MKIVSINLAFDGSTGTIIQGIHDAALERKHEFLMMAPWNKERLREEDVYSIGNRFFRRVNAYLGAAIGLDGGFSVISTIKTLRKLDSFNPDIIHLHNLHNNYINLPLLFNYIKKRNIPIIWTLHDCWAFTGHCPHFVFEKCYKWKTGCNNCPRYKEYPKSLFDNSMFMWKLKQKWFKRIEHLTIVTPSRWLAETVKCSYLKEYPVRIINNGIDIGIFKYTDSQFREKYQLEEKKIVLGVAFGWSNRKGLDTFIELSKSLPEDYQVILVGTDAMIDKQIPNNIVSIHKTRNKKELAEIYSAADVFVNPTREDTFPTVNLEALACGTPVITFNTGGSPECISENCGCVVESENFIDLKQKIIECAESWPNSQETCINHARQYDRTYKFEEYLELYEEAIKK